MIVVRQSVEGILGDTIDVFADDGRVMLFLYSDGREIKASMSPEDARFVMAAIGAACQEADIQIEGQNDTLSDVVTN